MNNLNAYRIWVNIRTGLKYWFQNYGSKNTFEHENFSGDVLSHIHKNT
jgi:hypothetical protein